MSTDRFKGITNIGDPSYTEALNTNINIIFRLGVFTSWGVF
jgi:hypothetical protein